MWISKNGAPAQPKQQQRPMHQNPQPQAGAKPIHVAHILEVAIADFLIKHGRLEHRQGRHLLHFIGATHNSDGSVDYSVRTRLHTMSGLHRNFESHVRIHSDHRLELMR